MDALHREAGVDAACPVRRADETGRQTESVGPRKGKRDEGVGNKVEVGEDGVGGE